MAYRGTIPRLLAAAADRDSDGVWLRGDSGSLTFGGAVAAAGRTAEALRSAGVRRGDLVMVTARNTPPYLICWLALAALGAVTVAVNPRGSAAELAGLAGQTAPRALITDAGLAALVAEAMSGGGVSGGAVSRGGVSGGGVSGGAVSGGGIGPAMLDVADLVPSE
jgi:acyl-CoA synthetase (AMP-forming)/AMP-acid ligase II